MLNWLRNNCVLITAILIGFVFTNIFLSKIQLIFSGESTCIAAYDGLGYYSYLVQFFEHGNLYLTPEFLQQFQFQTCGISEVNQLSLQPNGNYLNVYHMGMAYVLMPSYLIGKFFALIFHFPQNGFSLPYLISYTLNALLFIWIGIIYSVKLLQYYFSKSTTALVLLVLFFGTNYLATAIHSFDLPHIYLFAAVAIFFYFFTKYISQLEKNKYLYYSAITLGIISAIRPTHVLLGLIPAIYLWNKNASVKTYWRRISVFLVVGFLANLPQLLYWKLVGGNWFLMNLHVEEIIVIDPHIFEFLLSYKKGWLLYSPLFILVIPGFYVWMKSQKKLAMVILICTGMLIWIFASWECWWYAYSFGARPMIDLYPLLAIPIGFSIDYLRKQQRLIVGFSASILVLFIGLSLFQSYQYSKGIIDQERMTKAQYWYVFGQSDRSKVNKIRLEIDRTNKEWMSDYRKKNEVGTLDSMMLFSCVNKAVEADSNFLIVKFGLLDKLPTDEASLEFEMIYHSEKTVNQAILNLEVFSRYNVYAWNVFPLQNGASLDTFDTIKGSITLPHLHHKKDKLQIYIANFDRPNKVQIQSFKLKAIYLKRI